MVNDGDESKEDIVTDILDKVKISKSKVKSLKRKRCDISISNPQNNHIFLELTFDESCV